ncbi:Hypothetical predicted protein [Lecanosticta acicola]|uniref:Uncharacterized protein n=1 Tax=Lecanosticta acicola TaxID=111012 RepID=A0AAI8YSV2_9PEZI|nr:Hypothetical predicted protein [Lecanosticta acicola]
MAVKFSQSKTTVARPHLTKEHSSGQRSPPLDATSSLSKMARGKSPSTSPMPSPSDRERRASDDYWQKAYRESSYVSFRDFDELRAEYESKSSRG